jgi:acyl-CoA-binding protein
MEMELKELFEAAVASSKQLSSRPGNDVLLQLYSLYKQATEGDAPEEGPTGLFDIVGKAKHNAWAGQKGKTSEAAMQEYIDVYQQLKG